MKRFHFTLDPYLKVLQMKEKGTIAELGKVVGQINAARSKVDEYFSRSRQLLSQEALSMRNKEFNIEQRMQVFSYLAEMKKRKEVANREIVNLQQELHKRQQMVIEARKKRKSVEIIRERRMEDYKIEIARYETTEIDEFNSARKKRQTDEIIKGEYNEFAAENI